MSFEDRAPLGTGALDRARARREQVAARGGDVGGDAGPIAETFPLRRGVLAAIVAVAMVGLAVASLLTVTHFQLEHGLGDQASFCLLEGLFDCDRVNSSEFSAIAGLPVALIGEAGYAAIVVLAAIAAASRGERARRAAACLLLAAAPAVGFCAYLLFVAAVHVRALCSLCLILDVATVAVLGLSLLLRRDGVRAALAGAASAAISFPLRVEAWAGLLSFAATGALLAEQYERVGERVVTATLGDFEATYSKLPICDVPPSDGRPSIGPADAPVRMVFFGDFECGFCRRLGKTLESIRSAFPGKVRVEFRHFPICRACNPYARSNAHPQACAAALAAEAAHEQGRFWPYHDALIATKGRITEDVLLSVAREVGLDVPRFLVRSRAEDLEARIAADGKVARDLAITGTPLLFINGRRVRPHTLDVLTKAVLYELHRKDKS